MKKSMLTGSALAICVLAVALAAAGCTSAPAPHPGTAQPLAETVDLADRWGRSTVDSTRQQPPGALAPVRRTEITHRLIGENSGIVWLDGAFFVHNDSGDAATVYRSTALDFAAAEILPLPGARARDWEDIAVFEGDLLVGDIGDNRRHRTDVMLYRARYRSALEIGRSQGRLELVAAYPVRYPDGPHDAEGLAVVDGRVHLITKNRGEGFTGVYRFDQLVDRAELRPGEANVPRKIGHLELREDEQVTAADFDPRNRLLVVLTYHRVLAWPAERLDGPPALGLEIALKQCEAICVQDDRLVITNENREVYVIEEYVRVLPRITVEGRTP